MQEDRQQQYIELYESKYEDFIQEGMKPSKAQEAAYKLVEHCKEIVEGVSFMFDEGYYVNQDGTVSEVYMEGSEEVIGEFYTNLRYTIDVNKIPSWGSMDDASKQLALFNFGMDINLPVRERHGMMARKNAPPIETTYYEGSERLDYEYIHSGRATLDAVLEFERITRGQDHFRDLKEMSRQ